MYIELRLCAIKMSKNVLINLTLTAENVGKFKEMEVLFYCRTSTSKKKGNDTWLEKDNLAQNIFI